MLEEANPLYIDVARWRLQPGGASPENVVQSVWMVGRPGSLRSNQLEAERSRDPARDLVLQDEQIARVAVEPLGPQMRVGRGVDQLGTDADLIARSPDAPFEHITHAQLAANLLRVDGLVPIGEGGIARDYETVRDPREIGREVFGDPVREILLLPVVAEVCKGRRQSTGVAQRRAANSTCWTTRVSSASRLCLQGATRRPAPVARCS